MSELLNMNQKRQRESEFYYYIDTDNKIIHHNTKCTAFNKENTNTRAYADKIALYEKEFNLCKECFYEFYLDDKERRLNIFTDGGANKKKEIGYFACVAHFKFNDQFYILHTKGQESCSTTNRGEVLGIIKGLLLVSKLRYVIPTLEFEEIKVYSDSLYAVNTINGQYNISSNVDLFDYCSTLRKELVDSLNLEFEHIKGHNKDYWNELADRLCSPIKPYYKHCLPFWVERYKNVNVIDMNEY